MNDFNALPKKGKIIVVSPEIAVKLFDKAPEHAHRIFVNKGIDGREAYVFDLEKIQEIGGI